MYSMKTILTALLLCFGSIAFSQDESRLDKIEKQLKSLQERLKDSGTKSVISSSFKTVEECETAKKSLLSVSSSTVLFGGLRCHADDDLFELVGTIFVRNL